MIPQLFAVSIKPLPLSQTALCPEATSFAVKPALCAKVTAIRKLLATTIGKGGVIAVDINIYSPHTSYLST
jgi:hypothetical protein